MQRSTRFSPVLPRPDVYPRDRAISSTETNEGSILFRTTIGLYRLAHARTDLGCAAFLA
jgi:hypothetical protein